MNVFRKIAGMLIAAAIMNQDNQQVEASQIKQRINSQIDAYADQSNQQQWGFLKNIVNIDRFFAGPDLAEASGEKQKSLMQKSHSKASGHSLVQTRSKQKEDDGENEDLTNAQTDEVVSDSTQISVETSKNDKKTQQIDQNDQNKISEKQNIQLKQQQAEVKAEQSSKLALAEAVRNEGLEIKHVKNENDLEVDLEIDEEGAAQKIAEEGSNTIKPSEFQNMKKMLELARANKFNKLTASGFAIELKDPKDFENKINLVVLPNPSSLAGVAVEKFDTKDQKQATTAAQAMQMVLNSDTGSTIVSDDQPGKESIIQNTNSETSKYNSWISAGYSIRQGLLQKMAPGDKSFHTVNYQPNNQVNGYRTFPSRAKGMAHYLELKDQPKLLISGETGDVIASSGTSEEIDECLGNFFTARYNGKYYGQQ